MTGNRLFRTVLLLALGALLFIGCDSTTTTGEVEPRVGRGATISTTLLQNKSVAQINAEIAALGIPLSATYDVAIYKILYETVDADGAMTRASGALLVPRNAPGRRPMVSYQHGTMTARNDAPSAGGLEQFVGLMFATAGYVAVLPDLLGLGDSPGLHPFVHAGSSATAVVDMLRAAQDFTALDGPDLNGQLFLVGYSQGGYTVMAAHREIEASHSNEFQVTASAPMAGPYDLSGVMAETFTARQAHPSPVYLPYALLAYNDVYGLYGDPSSMFAAPFDTLLPSMFNGEFDAAAINDVLPDIPVDMLNPDFVASFEGDPNHPLRLRLQENDVYDWTPRAPIRLYHCGQDRTVPPENAQIALQHLQARGARVEFFDPLPSGDHGACAAPSLLLAKLWFDSLLL
ncbi:MAG: alpha/beta hydrolase family protein [Rhodothermales bacterium]